MTAGPVIYIAAEGAAGLRLRVPAWKRRHQRPGKAGVLFMPHVLDLLDEAQVLEFLDVASDVSPPLVIIDTLARCLAGGDENSAAHMGRLVGNADRIRKELNCTVLLLHHPTKQGKSERGHSALRGACDTVVKLAGARHSLLLKCEKQKDAEHFADISLHLDQVSLGDGLTSCVMVPTEDGQVSGVLPAPDRTALAALNTLPSGTATFGEWNAKAGIAERTLHRAADRLRSLGYLEKPEGKRGQYAITEEGRAVLGKAPLRTAI